MHVAVNLDASPLRTKCSRLLPSATKLGQGYMFTGVCHSVNGGGACMAGGMHGRGVCMAGGMAGGVHGWGGMHGKGVCGKGGMRVKGGHVW